MAAPILNAEQSYVASVVATYWFVSISIVYLNKVLVSDNTMSIPAPLFVTWFQCVVTALICWVCGEVAERMKKSEYAAVAATDFESQVAPKGAAKSFWHQFPKAEYKVGARQRVMPLSVVFVGMITFNNLCLKWVEVSFYNIARSLTIVFNVILSQEMLGSSSSTPTLWCLAVVIVGFFMGSSGEINFSYKGTVAGILSSLFVSLNAIYTKKVLPVVDNDHWKLTYYNNINATIMFIPIMLIFEHQPIAAAMVRQFLSPVFWSAMWVAGFFGFAIGIVTVLQIKATSPLTHNISGTAKAALQSILAFYIWGNQATILGCLGIAVVLGGSLLYTYVKMEESKPSSTPAPPPSDKDEETPEAPFTADAFVAATMDEMESDEPEDAAAAAAVDNQAELTAATPSNRMNSNEPEDTVTDESVTATMDETNIDEPEDAAAVDNQAVPEAAATPSNQPSTNACVDNHAAVSANVAAYRMNEDEPEAKAVVDQWLGLTLPLHTPPQVATRPANVYSVRRICGTKLLHWAENEVDQEWDRFEDAFRQRANEAAATKAWNDVIQGLIQDIRRSYQRLSDQTDEQKYHTRKRMECALIVFYFGILYRAWQDCRVIPPSLYKEEQGEATAGSLASRIPLLVRKRFLKAFAKLDHEHGCLYMTPPKKERCRAFILILFLIAHEQFDQVTNAPSDGPLKADFTRFVKALGIPPEVGTWLLTMAGCEVRLMRSGKLTAALGLTPSYYPTVKNVMRSRTAPLLSLPESSQDAADAHGRRDELVSGSSAIPVAVRRDDQSASR